MKMDQATGNIQKRKMKNHRYNTPTGTSQGKGKEQNKPQGSIRQV